MIAGDSITNGSSGDYTWQYRLWRDQVDRGAKINLVGRFKDTFDLPSNKDGSRAYLDCNFDQDRESRGGVKLWTGVAGKYGLGTKTPASSNPFVPSYPGATSWIRGATSKYKPSILVLFAGIFDLAVSSTEPSIKDRSEAGIANFVYGKLKFVIAEARRGNPGIDIILTTVPSGKAGSRYNLYNAKLSKLAKKLSTKKQKVVLAKMPSWTKHSWDGVHPNQVGEVAIAAVIDDKLHAINSKLKARPKTLAKPALGPRFPAVLSGSAGGTSTAKLSWVYPPGADRAIIYSRREGETAWVKNADLVLTRLRNFYPNEGTETCATRCTAYTVKGLKGGTKYDFMIRIGKGKSVSTLNSNIVNLRTSGL